jgi:hypothetical protein
MINSVSIIQYTPNFIKNAQYFHAKQNQIMLISIKIHSSKFYQIISINKPFSQIAILKTIQTVFNLKNLKINLKDNPTQS